MSGDHRLIAGAIVTAGVCIGLGLYFGLRAQGEASPPSQPAALVAPSLVAPARDASAATTTAAANDPTEAARAALQQRVEREVAKRLAELRPQMIESCWKPSVAKSADPASASFRMRLIFDANGHKTVQGIDKADDPRRQDVVDCLAADDIAIEVAAPGTAIGARYTLKLP